MPRPPKRCREFVLYRLLSTEIHRLEGNVRSLSKLCKLGSARIFTKRSSPTVVHAFLLSFVVFQTLKQAFL